MKKIYLDVCCLNRPWDDQSQERIRLESEGVLLILETIQHEDWAWVGSNAVEYEVDRMPDVARRQRIRATMDLMGTVVTVGAKEVARAESLGKLGFKAMDALHIACAEMAKCDVFLTADDRMLRAAQRNSKLLRVRVVNPIDWLRKVRP